MVPATAGGWWSWHRWRIPDGGLGGHVGAVSVRTAGPVRCGGLLDAFADRRLLLVLDDCEHVRAAAAELASALLRSCPGVVVLATSRQSLGIRGEHLYRVPSLDIPPPGASDIADIAGCSAAELFLQCAAQLRTA